MGQLGKEGTWGRMDTCVCMAESLYCPPETTPTLLTGYSSIPNKTFKEKKKKELDLGFPGDLDRKECACKTGDPG